MHSIILYDADYIIKKADFYLRNAAIYIEDNRIIDIGISKQIRKDYSADEEIDCNGYILFPGLINAHNHCDGVYQRGLGKNYQFFEFHQKIEYPINRVLSDQDFYHAALFLSADAIRNGSTSTILHCTNFQRFHMDSIEQGLVDSGIRGAVVRAGEDKSKIDSTSDTSTEKDIKESVKFLSKNREKTKIQAWLGPTGVYYCCTTELLTKYKQIAKKYRTKFHIHCAETDQEVRDLKRLGYSGSIAYAQSLGLLDSDTSIAHACWVNDIEMKILKKNNTQVIHCPSSNMLSAAGVAKVPRMLSEGLVVALGTDGPAYNDTNDIIREMKTSILLHRSRVLQTGAMNAKTALTMATANGAKILGIEDLGKLENGHLADIVGIKIRDNPSLLPTYEPVETLAYSSCGRDVTLNIVDGEILFRDGEFTKICISDICKEITRRSSEIAESLLP